MLGGDVIRLAVATAAAWAAWFVVFGVIVVATRPRRPDAAASSMDFPGDEPPALVNFLTNGWRVTPDAVPATLLDLAARGHVRIDHVPGGDFVVRLHADGARPDGDALTDYERQVYDHVRSLAVNGEVPGDALTTGPADESARWRRRFSGAVVADARRRGLTRPRWPASGILLLITLGVVPSVLGAATLLAASDDPRPFFPEGLWLSLALMGLVFIPIGFVREERDTPEGLAAAGRWLGLRRHLDAEGSFCEQPPAGVAIWERYLGYGAAMGVAEGALRQMPMGAESPYTAWSAYGGEWHVVRVRYPRFWPPGWGQKPWVATLLGFLGASVAGFMLAFVGWPVAGLLVELGQDETVAGPLRLAILLVGMVPVLAVTVAVAFFALMFLGGVVDLGRRKEVIGLVVRMCDVVSKDKNRRVVRRYLAVDDGESAEVRAYLAPLAWVSFVDRGEVVRLAVSPVLGHIDAVAVLPKTAQDAEQPAQ